ncbi:MAG: putative S-layer protein, partial [Candidatus Nanoarchaeia archaeon]
RLWVLNEDNDIYENEFDDEESTFDFPLNVEGGCSVEPQVAVSANLESGGQAGQELVVKATITNLGDELASYSVNAAGYTEWADSAGLDQNVVLLNAGDSVDVLITFSVKSDALGDQIFDIEIMSDNEIVAKQPVAVTISEGKGRFGITGAAIFGDNTFLWVIGFLNIALVIIIILVAVRVARK